MSLLRRPSLCNNFVMRFVRKPTRELKHGINTHRSNQAKKGESVCMIRQVTHLNYYLCVFQHQDSTMEKIFDLETTYRFQKNTPRGSGTPM
mgnify:CR=1 FL=1